jgi:diguanylate cyclase (GGDEF)-like protein/PAS domain S-box-containing protein
MHELIHHSRPDGTPYPVEECHIYEAFRRGHGTHIDTEVLWRRDGASFSAEYWSQPIHRDGNVIGTVVTFVNITERKQIEQTIRESEKRYRLLFERNLAGVFRTTMEGHILECNQAAAHMFGYDSPKEILATPTTDIYQMIADRESFLRRLKSEKSLTNHETNYRRKNGESAWAMINATLVDDDSGIASFIEGTFVDITERKVAEERVQSLAYFDALTGLPNRTLLRDRLSLALTGARRNKNKVALFFLDLDRFKNINDSLGHSAGDLLLKGIAERLKAWGREHDTIARLGGDEFVVVASDVKDIADAAVAAQRLMDGLTAEMVIQGHSLSVSCSLGISIYPEHGTDSETLIKHADAAMYTAKDNGRNNFQFFTSDMNAQAVERLNLENTLRTALDRKELFLMYQPQMDIASRKITGLEALLRWQHPKMGLVPPDEFIRTAENSGLIVPIGEWVLRTACSQARKWQDEGLTAVSVAVNVSAVQFRREGFSELIRQVLFETGLAPQYLELEVTESLLLSSADVTLSVLQELKNMGLSLAIDDFGTGYSSLSYLKRFPVSKLKIDRSFVRDVALNPDDAAITTAIISMAKSLNLKLIAEGVENEAQMSFLRAHQCDQIQGYYFSKPLAVDKVADKLRGDYPELHVRAQASGGHS